MNGWKNFATWYVYAHYISDDTEIYTEQLGMWEDDDEANIAYELQQILKNSLEELVEEDKRKGNHISADLAECFLSEVSWWEISRHILENEKLGNDA